MSEEITITVPADGIIAGLYKKTEDAERRNYELKTAIENLLVVIDDKESRLRAEIIKVLEESIGEK
jgi:hypothetical protein